MGKISVIVPVYNTQSYVEQCLQSLMNQSYPDLEILLINDHSNDTCTQLLEKIAKQDSRMKLFHFQQKKGVGAARNFGIQKSSGDYIYFLDSDDYLPEKTLELLIKNIGHYPMIGGRIKATNFSSAMAIILEGLFKIKSYTEKRYRLIKNKSVLNFLFKRDYIMQESLAFSEDVHIFSDLAFMVPALFSVEEVPYLKEAIYFKRKRNDPITNPSLRQLDEEIKIKDFLHVYNDLKDKYHDYEIVNNYLDKQLLNFYRKNIVTYFKDSNRIPAFFQSLSATLKRVNDTAVNRHNWVLKNEVKALLSEDMAKYCRVNNRHHLLREIRNGLKTKRKFYILLYRKLFMKLSMKDNLVFMESFLGKNYSDSPKYIYQYMRKQNMNYTFVWSVNEKKNIPGNPIQVQRFSLRYFYYLARAKYWVSNSRMPRYLDKREGNIYLQTWHGTPLKTLVFDMDDVHSADPKYKAHFYEQSRRWDYLSSPNQYSSDIFRRAFKFDKEMLEFGYPRNDILYKNDTAEDIAALKRKMNLPEDKKVVLYAPTWRDDEFYSRGKYKFTLQLDLAKLQQKLGDAYIVVLRMHYFIASQMDISEFEGFAFDFSSYDDIAELYLVSDILITDYSSVFFDYANLKRPILFFTYDLEKYRDKLRGFYIDIETEVPGPLLRTTDEVIHSIENIEAVQSEYQAKYDVFHERFCKWDDGNASKNTVERVFR